MAKSVYQKSELVGGTSNFGCKMLVSSPNVPLDLPLAVYDLRIDYLGWIVVINGDIFFTTGQVWSASYNKWKVLLKFATVSKHHDKGWNRTCVPIDIIPFITHPAHEGLKNITAVNDPYSLRTAVRVLLRPTKIRTVKEL